VENNVIHRSQRQRNTLQIIIGKSRFFLSSPDSHFAGVETMIVCLWEAPDKETVELMTAFYSLWTQGLDKKTAFSHAQLKMRQTYPDQPEKWAGFIMIE
jgi:hypothetical protein